MQVLHVRLITPSCQNTFYTHCMIHDRSLNGYSEGGPTFSIFPSPFKCTERVSIHAETVHFLYTFSPFGNCTLSVHISAIFVVPQSSLLIKRKYIIRPYGCSRAVIATLTCDHGKEVTTLSSNFNCQRVFLPLSLQVGLRFCFCPWAQGALFQTNAKWQW